MLEPFGEKKGPVYFISDAHLGAPMGHPDRERWLVDLLETLPGHIGGLFVVGDLFDFWFEYRQAIPKGHFAISRALAEIVRTGVPCIYFGGNHDFWAGTYLQDEIGLIVAQEPRSFLIQDRKVFVAHGDGLGRGDNGYKLLKSVLRNRLCIALYRSIHPDVGIPFAYRFSAWSRGHTEPRDVLLPKLVRDIASPHLAAGHDAVVMGHVHEPAHFRFDGWGEYLIIGDWIENFTYLILDEGRFTLMRRKPGGADEAIASEPPPGLSGT